MSSDVNGLIWPRDVTVWVFWPIFPFYPPGSSMKLLVFTKSSWSKNETLTWNGFIIVELVLNYIEITPNMEIISVTTQLNHGGCWDSLNEIGSKRLYCDIT